MATATAMKVLPYPTAAEEKKLKPYPFRDGGSKENAAVRMIRMAKPECPISTLPELKQPNGSYKANPAFTGEENCQQAFKLDNYGHWAVLKCEKLGHDPYYRTVRKPRTEEVVDENGYITETKTRYIKERVLNVVGVSDNIRHTSGQEIDVELGRGSRFIWEFGYKHPCEFRGCSQPWRVDTQYGRYCNERHARLIGADVKRKMLKVMSSPDSAVDVANDNEEILETVPLQIRRT